MTGYAIQDLSSLNIPFDTLCAMASELAYQQVDLAAWWERVPISVSAMTKSAPIPAGVTVASIVDALTDPNALAYHTIDGEGRPTVLIGANVILANGGTLTGTNSILTAISHELCETTCDPYCGAMYDLDGTRETSLEVCDWTQDDAYERVAGSGLWLSNFVGPRAFDMYGHDGPFDRMGLMSRPFELRPGGYISTRTGGPSGVWSDTFGNEMPDWLRAAKQCHGTRRSIRRCR